MTKTAATKAEREHMGIVKTMPCIACYESWYDRMIAREEVFISDGIIRCEYDHMVDGYRLGHMLGIALHEDCHRGRRGYQGLDRGSWDKSKQNRWKLIEKTYLVLGKEMPHYQSKIVPRRVFT